MLSKDDLSDFLEGIKIFFLLHTSFGNKNSINLELDEMYANLDKLTKETVKHLRSEGRNCEFSGKSIGSYPILIVEENEYLLVLNTTGNAATKISAQQVILKEI
ncbi:hypothetical protein [Orenia marismortui]|uniref:hypothetical protein n=1 Tax=Orenia marismortui TaxID=46469 RepID=UPI00036B620B|nr:hypothetical protein [Orenia marismortui]